MNHTNTVQTFIQSVFNQGNLDMIPKTIHPKYSYVSPTESMHGPQELAGFVIAFRAAFPDLHIAIKEQIESEDTVVTRIRFTGTHLGELLGMEATQKAVNIEGCVISKFRDGLIAQEWEILDQLTLLQQLGAAA